MGRHTINITPTQEQIIDELVALCDMKKGEIIADGLMLLSWAALEASLGLKIAAIDEKKSVYKEVRTPALLAAGKKARQSATQGAAKHQGSA